MRRKIIHAQGYFTRQGATRNKIKFHRKDGKEKDNTFFLSQICGVKRSVAHETTTLKVNTNWPQGSHKELLRKLKTTTSHQIRTAVFLASGLPQAPDRPSFSCKWFPTDFIHLSNCSCSYCRYWRGTRSYIHFRLRPLVLPPWPVLTVCDHGQWVALPDKLSHTASSFFTQRQHSWSCTDQRRETCPRISCVWASEGVIVRHFVWQAHIGKMRMPGCCKSTSLSTALRVHAHAVCSRVRELKSLCTG